LSFNEGNDIEAEAKRLTDAGVIKTAAEAISYINLVDSARIGDLKPMRARSLKDGKERVVIAVPGPPPNEDRLYPIAVLLALGETAEYEPLNGRASENPEYDPVTGSQQFAEHFGFLPEAKRYNVDPKSN
jgi:hypothetical protein